MSTSPETPSPAIDGEKQPLPATTANLKEHGTNEMGTNFKDQKLDRTMTENAESTQNGAAKPSKPNFIKRMWASTGLGFGDLLIMGKGGLPPTIALAMYQSANVAEIYTTLGYLVAIVSMLGFCVMPRARFVQNMILNIVSICLGAAIGLLVIFCTVQARLGSEQTPPKPSGAQAPTQGAVLVRYNPSASAVAALFLFTQIYLINTMKARYPQLAFSSIVYGIFSIVSCSYAAQFPNMAAGLAFTKRLLEAFLTGFGIATAVSLIVIPVTCRRVAMNDFTGYFGAMTGALDTFRTYITTMERREAFEQEVIVDEEGRGHMGPEAAAVKQSLAAIFALHGKLQADLPFAKREIGYGNLGADDLKTMNDHINISTLPILGLSAMIDLFERAADSHGWTKAHLEEGFTPAEQEVRDQIIGDWNRNLMAIHGPVNDFVTIIKEGIEHIQLQLKLKSLPKKSKANSKTPADGADDVEAAAQSTKPGAEGFAAYYAQTVDRIHGGKQEGLREWCLRKGIELPADFFEHPSSFLINEATRNETLEQHHERQRQLYGVLYIEFLFYKCSQSILEFVKFADAKVADGHMKKSHFIFPAFKQLKKWVSSVFNSDHSNEHTLSDFQSSNYTVYMGEAYNGRKDPEHLPPTNALERFGNLVRTFPAFMRSPESVFGFRAACATMSVGIIGFLEVSQLFYTKNRLLWAMIMVAISMTPTSGQSIFSFVLRILGTIVAMVFAFLVYYIPDGHTAGILVFLWIFASIGHYILIKQPQFAIIGMISIVTMTLIIGYELEARVIGTVAAARNGQTYLPITELAPVRLATVCGGLFVAWVWTIFPYPITEHSELRQDAGKALYLLANFYSTIHETVVARLRREEGDMVSDDSPGSKLSKTRLKVYSKVVMMLGSLRTHLQFMKWGIPIGGKFPKKQYQLIAEVVDHVLNYMALIGYASQTFAESGNESNSQWSQDFRALIRGANVTSHEITSLLSLLSAAVRNGQALPPYLAVPKPYALSDRLEKMDPDILSIRHINEPGYAAFAVMQISTRCVVADLERLLRAVKELVGELDFSFHVVSTEGARTDSFSSGSLSGQKEKNV